MHRIYFLLLALCLFCAAAQAQFTYGTVYDDKGNALVGATIAVNGYEIGVVTGDDGKYRIKNEGKDLIIGYVGMKGIVLIAPEGKVDVHMEINPITFGNYAVINDRRIKSVHNYSLLKRKEIELQSQNDLSPILNTSPGVLMHSGALNTNRITIRGIGNRSPFSTNRVKAYLDDIPLTNGSGETTVEDIDLSFIENIEIWKGPTSSRFGAGLGGMILMNSSISQGQADYVRNRSSIGSYGLQRYATDLALSSLNDKFQFRFNHNLTQSDGYRENNDYTRQGFTLLGGMTHQQNTLQIFVNHTSLKAFIPSSLSEEDYLNEPTKAAFTWGRIMGFEDYDRLLVGISYNTQLNKSLKLSSSIFMNNRDSYESRPFNILTENSNSMGLRTVFSVNPAKIQQLNFNVGTEVFVENYDWSTFETNDGQLGIPLSINDEKRSYANIFAEMIYNLKKDFTINAGVNFNTTTYELEDLFVADSIDRSGDYSYDPVFSPRIALNYQPRNNMDFYALVSHGFSPPSAEETLAPDGSINTEIEPEQAWNFEIGARSYAYDRRLNYEVSLFRMQVSDLLVARRTALDQFIGINAGKTIHNGLEAQIRYTLVAIMDKNLNLTLSYTFSDFKFDEFIDDEDDFSGNELTGTAPHIVNAILFGELNGFYSSLNFHFVDAMPLTDANTVYSDAYQLLHFQFGYRFHNRRQNWHFDISAGVNNVLDEKYAAMHQINAQGFGGNAPRYYYPGLPRNYYLNLGVKYNLPVTMVF
ncbi:MAG: TonB-dependent receptor [Bacteroidota bacterium]